MRLRRLDDRSPAKRLRESNIEDLRFLVLIEPDVLAVAPFRSPELDALPGAAPLAEIGASGEAADVMVACDGCDRKRPMVI